MRIGACRRTVANRITSSGGFLTYATIGSGAVSHPQGHRENRENRSESSHGFWPTRTYIALLSAVLLAVAPAATPSAIKASANALAGGPKSEALSGENITPIPEIPHFILALYPFGVGIAKPKTSSDCGLHLQEETNISSIAARKVTASGVGLTRKINGVPGNFLHFEIMRCCWATLNSLGALNLASSSSAWAARAFASAISASNPLAVASADLALAFDSAICASNPLAVASAWADSFRASVNNISSNVCTYPSALDTKLSATYSPATPTTINNQPMKAANFAQLGTLFSGSEKRNLRVNRQWLTIEVISCHSSGPSKIRPTTTRPVAANSQLKHEFLYASNPACMRSSTPLSVLGAGIGGTAIDLSDGDKRTDAMVAFIWYVIIAAVIYVIVSVLCIWEFTIGIKESIKNIFNGQFMLDIRRYIAYIMPRLTSHESARRCQTGTNHSGSGRRELD